MWHITRAQPAACQFRLVLLMKQRTSNCMCRVCFPSAPGLLWRQGAGWRESGPLAQGALHDVIIPKENNTREKFHSIIDNFYTGNKFN